MFACCRKDPRKCNAILQTCRGDAAIVRQREICLTITAEIITYKRHQRHVLAYCHQLPRASSPALWSKIKGVEHNLADKGVYHYRLLLPLQISFELAGFPGSRRFSNHLMIELTDRQRPGQWTSYRSSTSE